MDRDHTRRSLATLPKDTEVFESRGKKANPRDIWQDLFAKYLALTDPAKGLVTAIIAGFLISLLGGSRVQIGGPTGAFVVIVAGIVARYGVDGLIVATLMAGFVLVAIGDQHHLDGFDGRRGLGGFSGHGLFGHGLASGEFAVAVGFARPGQQDDRALE